VPVGALILLSYFVPYVLLDGVDRWYGSLLFWSVSTVIVIAINAIVSSAWRD
jgi:hypothetical protein